MTESAYQQAVRAQTIAAQPSQSVWVSANAGSGKTKVLIDRVARLLLNRATPDSILCITYTKAAANEMLHRLFDRLGRWSVMAEADLRQELVTLEGRQNSPHTEEEIRRARALFAKAVETPGGLRIETIHAFCARVLRRFPLEARVLPGFEEIDDVDAAWLWQRAVEQGIHQLHTEDPVALNVVSRSGGGFGISAGLQAIRSAAAEITTFRQSRRSEEAMDVTLRHVLGAPEDPPDMLIASAMGAAFPGAALNEAAAILEADGKRDSARTARAIRAALAAADPAARWAAYASAFFKADGDLFAALFNKGAGTSPLIGDLFEVQSVPQGSEVLRVLALDRDLKAAAAFERSRALLMLAEPVLKAYNQMKLSRVAVDFDDLIAFTYRLFTQTSAAEWVMYKLDGVLTHILLDEAQDTSPRQWGLINALVGEFFAGAGVERQQDPRTLFVVGDEKQSIYSFQGADPRRFLQERQQFEARSRALTGTAHLPDMAMSFRSAPEILAFVDRVSESGEVAGHPYIDGEIADFDLMRHTAFRSDANGLVELWPVEIPDPLEEDIPWHAPRDTRNAKEPRTQLAQTVAKEIAALLEARQIVGSGDKARAAAPGDVLILVQNRQGGLFDALIAALKAQDLPVAGADRLVLTDHIGVQDCLNLMRFVLLPEDDLTLAEILRGPFAGLVDDDRHLFQLAHGRDGSLWQALLASDVSEHRAVAAFLELLLERRHLPPFEFLSGVLDQPVLAGVTGWTRLLERLGSPARDPVLALMSRAIAHDAKGPASLQSFVAEMDGERVQIKRDLAASDGKIRVMTVHGAKGLQAPIVVLPDMTRRPQTQDPSMLVLDGVPVWVSRAADDTASMTAARETAKARQLREHRRLLYVAMTRAEDRLMIFGHWTGRRPVPGTKEASGYPAGSWYALCVEAMEALTGGEISAGEVLRYGPRPRLAAALAADRPAPAALPAWLDKPAPAEPEARKIIAAGALGRDDSAALPPDDTQRDERLKRGRLIHALLERLPEWPVGERRGRCQAFLARDTELTPTQREEMVTSALTVVEDARFAEIFAPGGRAEAPIVGTGAGLLGDMIVNGRVDRLVVSDTQVLIVDFKTDRPAPPDVSGVPEAYLAQMAAYQAVLRGAYPDRTVEVALVWTDGPLLMPLPDDLLAESLSQTSRTV